MYLVLYSNREDPIVSLLKNQRSFDKDMTFLSCKELLCETKIEDKIIGGHSYIHWTLKNGREISNSKHVKLINRVMYLDEQLFQDFHEDDRDYAYQEFYAYLLFALESFSKKLGTPGAYGLAGDLYPLPKQWEIAKNTLNLKVPEYYIGPVTYFSPHLFSRKNFIIRDSFYDYYFWKEDENILTELNSKPPSENIFIYSKPLGTPHLCLIAGEDKFIYSMVNGTSVAKPLCDKLKEMSSQLAKNFGFPLAEILFFCDGDDIYFGFISNTLWSLGNHPEVKDIFAQHIKNFFNQKGHLC